VRLISWRAEAMGEAEIRNYMSTAAANDSCSPHCGGRRILVIDDETSIQTLLSQILAGEGYRVRTVGTARHALSVIRDEGFDVVISDISLPDADGVELVRQICSEFPHVSVVAMSGFMAAIPPARLYHAGAAATLQKPFTARQLLCSLSEFQNPQCVSVAMG
jgi:DNA-binding NtrC family response regulator